MASGGRFLTILIDSHQHFWSLRDPWFAWPTPDLASIYRDIGPADLRPTSKAAGIGKSILVQVAPSVPETEYLLDVAARNDFVAGVVGWVDLETGAALADLERFAARDKFVGIRPMIQSIPDVELDAAPDADPCPGGGPASRPELRRACASASPPRAV